VRLSLHAAKSKSARPIKRGKRGMSDVQADLFSVIFYLSRGQYWFSARPFVRIFFERDDNVNISFLVTPVGNDVVNSSFMRAARVIRNNLKRTTLSERDQRIRRRN